MAVVVWTDVSSGSSSFLPPNTTKAEGFVFDGHHRGPDGRHIDCRCATKDGRTGGVSINDKTFDLDQGALFLVSTISGQTQVRQLKREVLQSGGRDLKDLAKNDQEIRYFFASFASEVASNQAVAADGGRVTAFRGDTSLACGRHC